MSAGSKARSGWIRVEDRLPPVDELVIANSNPYGPLLADRTTRNPQAGWSCDGYVTHWMALPVPPATPMTPRSDRMTYRWRLEAAQSEKQPSIGERLRAKGYADVPSNTDRIASPQQARWAAIRAASATTATRDTIIEQCIAVLDTHGLASIFTPDKALTIRQVLRAMKDVP